MTDLKKIQTGMSWAAHVKKEVLMGQPKTQLILAAPVIINDTCQLPGFVVNFSPIVTTLKHLKSVTMLTNPWAPTSHSGAAASAQRRRRRSDHLRQCLICNESTELAQCYSPDPFADDRHVRSWVMDACPCKSMPLWVYD